MTEKVYNSCPLNNAGRNSLLSVGHTDNHMTYWQCVNTTRQKEIIMRLAGRRLKLVCCC